MIQFGTGGWRAIIGDEFTKENVQKLSQAIVNLMETKEITIGYDRRFLSDLAATWAAEVFAANDIHVLFNPTASPTPMTMFRVQKNKLEAGMAITASHNPAHYNGIKVFKEGGQDIDSKTIEKIEKELTKINQDNIHTIPFEKALKEGIIQYDNPQNEYIDAILEKVDQQAIRNANLKIGLDPMFGVSKTSLSMILNSLRCDLDVIHDRHDTLFGGKLPSPAASNLYELSDIVKSQKMDLGIATDGDADRIGIINEKGEFVHPNTLLALLYHYFLSYRKETGAVVRNLSTTHMLDQIAEKHQQKVIETPVGFRFISEAMLQNDAIIGGESSGGLTLRGHIPGKDGIFAAVILVEMLSITGKTMSQLERELEEEYGKLYHFEGDYRIPSREEKKHMQEKLFEAKEIPQFPYEIKKVSYMDGLKIYFEDNAWISLRFSGTEPLIRIFAESPNKKELQDIVQKLERFLNLEKEKVEP